MVDRNKSVWRQQSWYTRALIEMPNRFEWFSTKLHTKTKLRVQYNVWIEWMVEFIFLSYNGLQLLSCMKITIFLLLPKGNFFFTSLSLIAKNFRQSFINLLTYCLKVSFGKLCFKDFFFQEISAQIDLILSTCVQLNECK